MKSLEAKVVVLGSQGVGKTSVVIRYVGGMFSKAVSPTIGASFFTYKLNVDNYRVKLQVWDTAGQERFRSMAPMYYRKANAAMLIYDITSSDTFYDIKDWAPMYYRKANAAMLIYDITSSDTFYDIKDWVSELKRNVDTPIVTCLIGNKCDLEDGRQVIKTEAAEYAESIGSNFFETSALKNTGIEEAFLEVAKRLIKLYETSPSSGLHTGDTLRHDEQNNDDKIHIEPPSRHKGPPPSSQSGSKCGC